MWTFRTWKISSGRGPLNPSYRQDEFEFYMGDIKAKALIVALVTLTPEPEAGAPAFRLSGATAGAALRPGQSEPDDVALVLHTSGTTSRPKVVPLTQANVCASARSIAATLELSEHDRALNVMPLFHIHGLIAGLAAPLSRGGSVLCTPRFNALIFLRRWRPPSRPGTRRRRPCIRRF